MSTFMDSILTTQYELHRQILEVIALIPYGKVATYTKLLVWQVYLNMPD